MTNNVSTQEAALAQARREALAAARAREIAARQAAEAQARAAAKQAQPQPAAAPRVATDRQTAQGEALLKQLAGPQGEQALAAAPEAVRDAASLIAALASPEASGLPPSHPAVLAARDLLNRLQGQPPVAAGAVTGTLLDPESFYALGQSVLQAPEAERSAGQADLRQAAALSTPDHLAAQLEQEPDLSKYPQETLQEIASFRKVENPRLQAALDAAVKRQLDGLDGPDALSPEVAYLASNSPDTGVRSALQGKVEGWATDALKHAMDGKKKEEGAKQGLSEYSDALVKLAERTGLGETVQKAGEKVLHDNKGLVEEVNKRGRSLWDKVTGAIGGFFEHAFGAIGDGIKSAIGAVGDVAKFTVKAVGKVSTVGLDLAAAGLDAVGADGAAKAVRKVDHAVEGAYDFVGNQVDGFVHGVGDALGDTVEGVGAVIAHPVETVKGVAHLVTHPQEIATVGKALWAQASEGGFAHALGYVAGNLAPALLSGGSTSGGTVLARLGAVAGESTTLTAVVDGAKASRVVQLAGRAAEAGSQVLSKVGETRLVRGASEVAGGLKSGALKVVKESPLGKLGLPEGASNQLAKLKDFRHAFNDRVDTALGKAARRLDDTAAGRGVQRALSEHVPGAPVTAEARLAELRSAALGEAGLDEAGIRVEGEVQGVVKQGKSGEIREKSAADALENREALSQRELGAVQERGLRREHEIQGFDREGSLLQGTSRTGRGTQPDVLANFNGPLYEERIGKPARAIGTDPSLTAEEKLQRINALVNEHLQGNFTAELDGALQSLHEPFNSESLGHRISTEDYLEAGLADCRGFAALQQMALQDAGFKSGIAVSKTVLEDISDDAARAGGLVREADGLSHYYNVVEHDGKQIIADAFNPAASGHELAEALARGFVDRDGQRLVHYLPGNYGATILRDGTSALHGLPDLAEQLVTQAAATGTL